VIAVVAPPRSLLCELTYRCNLQCPYCYNPLNLGRPSEELSGEAWLSVIDQATDLGVVQIGFSGGEPTLRPRELVAMTQRATERGAYSNLITQGTFLDDRLLDSLLDALKGGVTSIPPDRAVQVIDSWSSKLSGTGSPELGSIARDLDQLKSGLTSGNLAGVNSLLSGIGSKVSAISASDSSGKLSQLGEALSAGAAPSGDPSI